MSCRQPEDYPDQVCSDGVLSVVDYIWKRDRYEEGVEKGEGCNGDCDGRK